LIADVGRLKEAWIFDQKLLKGKRRFETNTEVAIVLFQHGEALFTGLKRGMSPRSNFSSGG